METTTDTKPFPESWKHHLLRTHPSGRLRGVSRMEGVQQMHSMQRDEQGRFNNLSGGKPDFTEDFERRLDGCVRDMMAEGRVQGVAPRVRPVETITPEAIDRSIDRLRRYHPTLFRVLAHFQLPYRLRHWDNTAMAGDLGVSERQLYRWRDDALSLVWHHLPAEEHAKVGLWQE